MKRKRLMSAAILCTGVAMSVPRIPRHSRSSPSDSEAADSGGHERQPIFGQSAADANADDRVDEAFAGLRQIEWSGARAFTQSIAKASWV
jgi:hypothetical protein